MSCRVLKRGMEEYIINRMVSKAASSGARTIKAEYIPTPKNKMVEHIYESMGFDTIGDGLYSLDIERFSKLKTFIS